MFHFNLYYILIFIPIVIILYSIFKKEYRKYILLLASLILFFSISGRLIFFILVSSYSIHHFGIWLDSLKFKMNLELENCAKEEKKNIKEKYLKEQRKVLIIAIISHIGLLIVLKYSEFLAININSLLTILKIPFQFKIPKYLLPIGISFYTLTGLSYIIDVYNNKIKAEQNLFKLILFLSFFPYLIEGPIVRYEELKDSLYNGEKIKYYNLTFGYQRIIYGFFKKMIIADRLNILIRIVFSEYYRFSGSIILFAAICYTIQLYAEFSGTMDVAIGTADIFGIKLPENFHNPFFSKNISEFWQRWHITLGRWFKDYIFYPVATSKPLKKLTLKSKEKFGNYYGPVLIGSIALLSVWISNGIWHGAAWKYIFFGLYHFTLIFLESLLLPLVKKICKKLRINCNSRKYHCLQIIKTFILVVIGELFFRVDGLSGGLEMIKIMFTNFRINDIFSGLIFLLGIDVCDCYIIIIALIIVFIVSVLKEKGKNIREIIAKQPIVIRWTIYYILILSIIIFGAYGPKYIPVQPIYAEF